MNDLPGVPGMDTYPPASETVVLDLEQRLGQPLPTEYRQFLRLTNGASLAGGLLLYNTGEIEERNATWQVAAYAPGYLAIGDTGGGEAILLQLNSGDSRLFIVGTGSMAPEMARELAPSLEQWLVGGCELPED